MSIWCGLLFYPFHRQCEKPEKRGKADIVPTPFLIIKPLLQGIRGINDFLIMKYTWIALLLFSMFFVGACSSGGEDVPEPTPKPETKPETKPSITFASTAEVNPVFNQEGGEVTISFIATEDWTASVTNTRADNWITVSPTSGGKGENTITITTTANDTYDERNATISLKCGTVTESVEVGQEGVKDIPYLTFIAEAEQTLAMWKTVETLEYSVNDEEWKELGGKKIDFGGRLGNLRIRGKSTIGTDNSWIIFGNSVKVSCIGDIRTLIDYDNYEKAKTNNANFSKLFYNCQVLITAPELPATDFEGGSYSYMFEGCTSLTVAPELPATKIKGGCYYGMFKGCTSLTVAPELPATNLDEFCYTSMFEGCISLTKAPELPATNLAKSCYWRMFSGCINLTSVPTILPATNLTEDCYGQMFAGCTSLTVTPELPATNLANYCCTGMFGGCTSLVVAPELPATIMTYMCYDTMFAGCTSLIEAPDLPAMELATQCYSRMFEGCTSLTTAPELPAEKLGVNCYYGMFGGCTSLATAPELPAKYLEGSCYSSMFEGCTSLTIAPELPATDLEGGGCYNRMFAGCTSLTSAPKLQANNLTVGCYYQMFAGCCEIKNIIMLATNIGAEYCLDNWLEGVSPTGTFTKAKEMTSLPIGVSGIPEGWEVVDYEE